jgi:uncharacterized LabA/DUF88 family protein
MFLVKENKTVTYAFIDAENVRNAVEDAGFEDLDYNKLRKWIHNRCISKVFIYVGIEHGDAQKISMFEKLQKNGYEVRAKTVMAYKQNNILIPNICPFCKKNFNRKYYVKDKKKANCDSELTLDVIRTGMNNEYSEVIMFTGDGDFARLMEYVSVELKKSVVVISSSGPRTSTKIKELNKKGIVKFQNLEGLFQHYTSRLPHI